MPVRISPRPRQPGAAAIAKVQALTEKAGPVIERAGLFLEGATPVVGCDGQILETAERILEENRPRIAEISSEVAGIARTGREQVERLGELLHEAAEGARARLESDQEVRSAPKPTGQRQGAECPLFFLLRKVFVLVFSGSQGRNPRRVQEGSLPPIHPRIPPTSRKYRPERSPSMC
jgi:hypothetical protein